eukprot:c12885_g1_i2 orf=251-1576(-)
MATSTFSSTDGNLYSSIGQGHRDMRTMACCQGYEVSRVFLVSRPQDVGRTLIGIRSNVCKGWTFNQKRNKGDIFAALSFEDSSKAKDCSQFSSIKANVQGKSNLWLNIDSKERVGVLLLNLGGPETLDDVQPFLYNLFADPDIIRLPRLLKVFQQPIARFISVVRAPKSKEGYSAIGGGSPLRKITEDQIKKDQITKLVVLPLYPQFSISTSGSSLRVLEEIFRKDQYLVNMQHTVIPSWYQREGYLKAMATLIDKELKTFKQPNEVVIFFSAHGVPLTYVEDAGDPYKEEMEKCVKLVMTELKKRGIHNKHALAYQSRVGPVEWLKPYTDDTIKELGKMGVKGLLAVPISFVSEHIETLEEIDVEYRDLALVSGIEEWGRVPALGCEKSFICDLADAVIEELQNDTAKETPTDDTVWTISRTLQDYFMPNEGRAWMEWLS